MKQPGCSSCRLCDPGGRCDGSEAMSRLPSGPMAWMTVALAPGDLAANTQACHVNTQRHSNTIPILPSWELPKSAAQGSLEDKLSLPFSALRDMAGTMNSHNVLKGLTAEFTRPEKCSRLLSGSEAFSRLLWPSRVIASICLLDMWHTWWKSGDD